MRLAISSAAVLLLSALPGPAHAQRVAEGFHYDPPSDAALEGAGARAKVVVWTEMARNSRTMNLVFRNTGDRPVEIVSYRFTECVNVLGAGCGKDHEGPEIQPGETVVVHSVRQRNIDQEWSVLYEFQARWTGGPPPRMEASGVAPLEDPDAARKERLLTGWVPARYEYVDKVMPILLGKYSVPGAAIVLTDDANVQWSAGYGVAYEGGPPITSASVFRAGSLGEPVVALMTSRLADVRGWGLQVPVSRWAHEHTIPAGYDTVSAADLLSHIGSGAWERSDADYALLQDLIETAEGHDLEVLVQSLVFEPHRLTTMSFAPPANADAVRGHGRDGQPLASGGPAAEEGSDASHLYTSAHDYARFLIDVSPLSGRDEATWRVLTRERVDVSDELGVSWGTGWGLAKTAAGSPIAVASQDAAGFQSFALVDEVYSRSVVIFTNGGDGLSLVADLLRFLDAREHAFLPYFTDSSLW